MPAVVLIASVAIATLGMWRGPLRGLGAVERAALAFGGAVLALAMLSLVACRLGVYSAWAVSGPLSLLWAFSWRRSPEAAPPGERHGAREVWLVAGLLLGLLALHASYPTYFLLGGQDPGLYLEFAAWISKTGGLDLDQAWLRDAFALHGHAIQLGYPGVYSYYGDTHDAARLSPQFAHLFPALLANFWSAGGLEAAVRGNAVVAAIGLSLGYAYVRRLLGVGAGCVLVVALGLNPAFALNARITLTEALALAQNFGGLLALLVAQERRSVVWGLVAGGVLGSGTFNRVDAGLIGVAPLAFSVVVMVCSPELRRVAAAAGAGYLLLSTAGHLDVARAAPFYVHDLVQGAHLGVLMAGSSLWGGLAVALPFVPARVIARARLTERTLRWLSFSVFVGLTLWLAWGLLVRPRI